MDLALVFIRRAVKISGHRMSIIPAEVEQSNTLLLVSGLTLQTRLLFVVYCVSPPFFFF